MTRKFSLIITLTAIPFFAFFSVAGQTTDVLLVAVRAAIEKQDYETAITAIDTILKRQPKNDDALAQRARIFVRQNKLDLAFADADNALKINPRNFEALNARGVAKRDHLKDRIGALEDFIKASAIKPDYFFSELNQGITLSMMGRLPEASAAFDRAAAIAPGNPSPYFERARFLTMFGRYSKAIPDYDKAIALSSSNAVYFSLRAYNRFRLYVDRKAQAEDLKGDIDRSLVLDPNNALALALRSLVATNGTAAADAEKAIGSNPNGFLGYVARGFVKADRKEYDSSLDDFEKARALAPNDKWVVEKRDLVLERATGPRALALKAEVAKARKEAAETELESAKKTVIEDPWDFTAYDSLSDVRSAASRAGVEFDLKAFLEKLLSENPKNICAIRFLGEYKGGRDFREMVNYLNDGLSLYDGKNGTRCAAEIAFRIGREYSSRNLRDEAATYFARAREIKPDLKYLDQNIAANEAEKAEDERQRAAFAALSVPTPQTGSATAESKPKTRPEKPCTASEIEAAVRAYNREHALIEADILEYNSALSKFLGAGGYRYLYRGTFARLQRIPARMSGRIWGLVKEHGRCMPAPLYNHLMADAEKARSADPPPPPF